MTKIFFTLSVLLIFALTSCHKPGKIQVQNNISNVKLIDVKWGDIYICTEVLPGEASKKLKITRDEEKLPSSHQVTFKMYANQQYVYLTTQEEFLLEQDEEILIVLDDDTKIINDNQ